MMGFDQMPNAAHTGRVVQQRRGQLPRVARLSHAGQRMRRIDCGRHAQRLHPILLPSSVRAAQPSARPPPFAIYARSVWQTLLTVLACSHAHCRSPFVAVVSVFFSFSLCSSQIGEDGVH